jgi:hypothetical protein
VEYTFFRKAFLPVLHISLVGIATSYGLDDRGSGVQFPAGAGNFSLLHRVQNGSGARLPPIQWVPKALSLGVKRPGREADHSLPSSAEVQNAWRYTSTPQYVFMAWCLVKHRDFTFSPLTSYSITAYKKRRKVMKDNYSTDITLQSQTVLFSVFH